MPKMMFKQIKKNDKAARIKDPKRKIQQQSIKQTKRTKLIHKKQEQDQMATVIRIAARKRKRRRRAEITTRKNSTFGTLSLKNRSNSWMNFEKTFKTRFNLKKVTTN